MCVRVLNLGATIQSIQVPASEGHVETVLGYEDCNDYWTDPAFMGAMVGRYTNRIRSAEFSLGGRVYSLDANETSTGHCLHGGSCGFHRQFWTMQPKDDSSLECRYLSPDGESGFPGNLQVSVNYLVYDNSLLIDVRATTDSETVVSIANHAYFNLDRGQRNIDGHHIQIDADYFTPADDSQIPNGEIRGVGGSDFDLRQMTPIFRSTPKGERKLQSDHNFVLSRRADRLRKVAELYCPDSGIGLRLHTTQPGLQFYTGDNLSDPFRARQGLCLEAQGFPDAPNQTAFPSARLAPGEIYQHRTVYEFVSPSRYF